MVNLDEGIDETVSALADLFHRHPAWRAAARYITRESMSDVYFTHRRGEVWRLVHAEQGSSLVPGKAQEPDFVFRFAPGAVTRLQAVEGGLGDFAAELFSLFEEEDPDQRVDLRVAAPFAQLRKHGFLKLLLSAGPKAAAFGFRRGVFSVTGLAKLVRNARRAPVFDWES